MRKYLPTDVSTFSTLINGNYLYVDKTDQIFRLFSGGSRYYFLSRPRRFGKSLLISVLKEFFSGNKKLFEGLAVNQTNYSWPVHPVIHLDFSTIAHATPEQLETNLAWTLDLIGQQYGIDTKAAPSSQAKFTLLLMHLKTIYGPNSVVLLVDEYDKPLIDHLDDIPAAFAQQELLRSFYDTLKGMDEYMRAIFITGVSKFSKTSIFSGINNLNDISLEGEASTLLGYTQAEIIHYFQDYVDEIAHKAKEPAEKILEDMRVWYNGYRFSDLDIKVYNPFSILYYLHRKKLINYWFESGTPFFLVHLFKKEFPALDNIQMDSLSRDSLGTFNIENIPLITLLFQTGYLTIVDYDEKTDKFKLDYPNFEVKESLNKYLLTTLTSSHPPALEKTVSRMTRALQAGDIDEFCRLLQILFAHIPYSLHIERESYFHSLFQFLAVLIDLDSNAEVLTDKGRIDMVIKINPYVYVFELKYNADPGKALEQIEKMKYYERYQLHGDKLVLVGLAFNYVDGKLHVGWVSRPL